LATKDYTPEDEAKGYFRGTPEQFPTATVISANSDGVKVVQWTVVDEQVRGVYAEASSAGYRYYLGPRLGPPD
jgi:hypothetical protein